MRLKKIMAYVMVLFLILNLFSHVTGTTFVQAAGEYGISAVVELFSREDDPDKNTLRITYYVADYVEGTDIELERCVIRDGEVIASDILVFSDASYTEEFTDDGDYIIEYRLMSDPEQPLEIMQLLDNEKPVLAVTENEDGTIDVTVSDRYLDANCCQLQYKRVFLEGFEVREITESIGISLDAGEGQYTGKLSLAEILKETVGEGIYSDFVIKATDKGNHTEELPLAGEVTIDESGPVIAVEVVDEYGNALQGEPADDGTRYYDGDSRKLKIKIVDLQLKEPECQLYKNAITGVSPEMNSSLEDNPYIKELVFPFDADGRYILDISAEDLSVHAVSEHRVLIRDTKEPVFEIRNTMLSYVNGDRLPAPRRENGKDIYYVNQSVAISFDVEELNYYTASVAIMENNRIADSYPRLMTENPQTFTKKYQENGNYHVYAWARDKAGNYCESDMVDFVIDDRKPEISIQGIENKEMTKNPVTLTFEATDVNHDFDNYKITIKNSNYIGYGNMETYTYSEDEWQVSGDNTVTKQLAMEDEGNYEVTFEAMDKAGNVSVKTVNFSIDRTAPVISNITYENVNGPILPRYNIIFSNQVIELEFDLYDDVVGVDANKVYVTVGNTEDRELDTPVYIAHRTVGNRFVTYIPTDMNLRDFDGILTIWANDKLGNESNLTSDHVIYSTDYARIRMTCDTDYSKWTNQDVTFHTTIKDQKSGLDRIVYKVNHQVVKTVQFHQLTYEYTWDVTASESASLVTGYPVEVEVTNNCGTTQTMTRQVYIDKENPKVQFTGIDNGAHYATDKEFVTVVEDVSYTNTYTKYVMKRTLEGREEQIAVAPFHSSNYEDRNTLTMMAEGKYEVYAITEDGAGNTATSDTLQFVIDKTAPRLSITGTSDGVVTGQPVSLMFSCEEIYYDTNTVNISVEQNIDNQTSQYQITGFPRTGKQSVMSHTFSEDGSYVVTMSARDKAGNVAVTQKLSFVIDRTKPEISVEGTTNYQLWDTAPVLSFVVEESYYATNQVSITGTRTDIEGKVHDILISDFASSGKISRLNHTFDDDGIYHLILTSKDEAGNMDRKEIHFTVDKTAPDIYLVNRFQGGYFYDFCLTDDVNNLFRDLTVISYKILLNGVEYNGTDRITAEGKYSLHVEVSDELGHMSNAVAEFIIDHTAPKVIFAGVKDGQMVHEAGNVILSLTNTEDEITSVRLNGEELGAQVRNIAYTEQGSYQIDVDCRDQAGNQVTRSIYFVYSEPMVIVLIAGSLAAIVLLVCGWLLMTRKKQKKKE